MQRIEQKICERIRDFDVVALLQLLAHIGYRREEILFRSHYSNVSPASLLEDIEFRTSPSRQVIITFNAGLLSAVTPLPSYFMKMLDAGLMDEKAFVDFLGFFDHNLLGGYWHTVYPEFDQSLYPDWEMTKRAYLRLTNLCSANSVHHLFHLVFPELGICVEKKSHTRHLKSEGIHLGETELGGRHIMGGQARLRHEGCTVTMYCDEEYSEQRIPWADKIYKRLHTVLFPVLREAEVDLKVILVIRSQKGWIQLQPNSYLGMEKIRGGEENNRIVVIFDGIVR